MTLSQPSDDLAQAMLDAAKAAGADAADAIVVSGESQSIETLSGKLETADSAEGVDIGLRVLIGQKQAVIGSSDVRPQTITEMADRAVAMAQAAPDDPYVGLADAGQLATTIDAAALELYDPDAAPDPQILLEKSLEAEAAALDVQGVSQVQASGAGYSATDIFLAASNGFAAGYRRSGWSISCVAITGTGAEMERDYCGESRVFWGDLPSASEIGRLAGERTVERAGPTKPPTGTYPVLFDERISSSLIGHLLGAINGNAIARGASWLKDAMGEQVLPAGMDLIEDPTRARISGSKPFDGEGLPVSRRHIVRDGRLQSWTLDLATARRLGLESTGNASRGTTAPPSPTSGNMALTQSARSRADLLGDMGEGLLVTSMIGSTINPTTGDYSRGASGFWIKNGQISHPVNECTIAGNLRDMLTRIQPANDARTHLSRVVPSLLIEAMTVAGS